MYNLTSPTHTHSDHCLHYSISYDLVHRGIRSDIPLPICLGHILKSIHNACRSFILAEMWTTKDRQWYIPSFVTRFRNKHLRKVLTYFIPYKNRKPIFMESKQIDEILNITVNCGWDKCFHYQFCHDFKCPFNFHG